MRHSFELKTSLDLHCLDTEPCDEQLRNQLFLTDKLRYIIIPVGEFDDGQLQKEPELV